MDCSLDLKGCVLITPGKTLHRLQQPLWQGLPLLQSYIPPLWLCSHGLQARKRQHWILGIAVHAQMMAIQQGIPYEAPQLAFASVDYPHSWLPFLEGVQRPRKLLSSSAEHPCLQFQPTFTGMAAAGWNTICQDLHGLMNLNVGLPANSNIDKVTFALFLWKLDPSMLKRRNGRMFMLCHFRQATLWVSRSGGPFEKAQERSFMSCQGGAFAHSIEHACIDSIFLEKLVCLVRKLRDDDPSQICWLKVTGYSLQGSLLPDGAVALLDMIHSLSKKILVHDGPQLHASYSTWNSISRPLSGNPLMHKDFRSYRRTELVQAVIVNRHQFGCVHLLALNATAIKLSQWLIVLSPIGSVNERLQALIICTTFTSADSCIICI